MAHGMRGRLALLGTGLLFCLGCMNEEPKPIGKPPLSQTGSGVKPNLPAGGTTYGGGVQPANYTTTGRNTATPEAFKSGSMAPTVPGITGTGTSMTPPQSIVPPSSPTGFAPTPSSDPYAGGRPVSPTQPPYGYDLQPPVAPGGPSNSYPVAPTAPAGAVNNYGK